MFTNQLTMNNRLSPIAKINRNPGMVYKIDREGNVLEFKYNLLADPWTLVTLVILILGGVYYIQMSSIKTNEANFEDACLTYIKLREYWVQKYGGAFPTLEEVFSLNIDATGKITDPNNFGG